MTVEPRDPYSEVVDTNRRWTPEWYSWLKELVASIPSSVSGGISDGTKGDIVVSGGGTVWTVGPHAVTFAKMAQITAPAFLGRVTAGLGDVEALTGTQATAQLDLFTSSLKGLVPPSGGGTVNFLRADGTFAAPPSGGSGTPGGSSGQVQYNNAGSFGGFTVGGDATLNTGTGALTIANTAVTYAKIQNTSTGPLLLGHGSGSGSPQEIGLGTGLSMSGTTLNAALSATYQETIRNAASAVAISSSSATDIMVLNLNAGDWDIQGEAWWTSTATGTLILNWLTTVSGTAPSDPAAVSSLTQITGSWPSGQWPVVPLSAMRLNIGSLTTVRLGAFALFTGGSGTASVYGKIRARKLG